MAKRALSDPHGRRVIRSYLQTASSPPVDDAKIHQLAPDSDSDSDASSDSQSPASDSQSPASDFP